MERIEEMIECKENAYRLQGLLTAIAVAIVVVASLNVIDSRNRCAGNGRGDIEVSRCVSITLPWAKWHSSEMNFSEVVVTDQHDDVLFHSAVINGEWVVTEQQASPSSWIGVERSAK